MASYLPQSKVAVAAAAVTSAAAAAETIAAAAAAAVAAATTVEPPAAVVEKVLLRGSIVNGRTYGIHKNLHISLVLPTIFGPIDYAPP